MVLEPEEHSPWGCPPADMARIGVMMRDIALRLHAAGIPLPGYITEEHVELWRATAQE